MKSTAGRRRAVIVLALLAALATVADADGQLYSLGSAGAWEPLGIAVPAGAVDIEGNSDTLLARLSTGAFLQYVPGSGSWTAWATPLPSGTVEVRFMGDFAGPDTPLLARTTLQEMYLLHSGSWQRTFPDFPPGTSRVGVGNGVYAVTSAGRIQVLADTTWIDAAATPGPAWGIAYYQGTIFSMLGDGTWQSYDIPSQAFSGAALPTLGGVRLVLVYQGRLTAWK